MNMCYSSQVSIWIMPLERWYPLVYSWVLLVTALMVQTSSSPVHMEKMLPGCLWLVELYASQVDGQMSCIKSSRFIHAVKFLMHKNCGLLNLAKVSNHWCHLWCVLLGWYLFFRCPEGCLPKISGESSICLTLKVVQVRDFVTWNGSSNDEVPDKKALNDLYDLTIPSKTDHQSPTTTTTKLA